MAENAYNELAARTAQRESEAQAALRQRMSDLGLASNTLTLQNQAQMASQANLGQISRQQQGQAAFDEAMARQAALNLEAQQQGASAKQSFGDTMSSATLQSIRAFGENKTSQQKALNDAALAQQNALQGLDIGLAKAEYALDEESRRREMYYQMFLKGKLSAKQFKDATGIAIKAFSTGRSSNRGLVAAAVSGANAELATSNATAQAALKEQQAASNGPVNTATLGRMERAAAAVAANPVKQSITYRDVLNNIQANQVEYVSRYGTTEYNRAVSYMSFRADAADNNIDLAFFAPSYQQYADLIENPDKYIQQYGTAGYNTIVSSVSSSFKSEIANVYNAIELKNSGAFSADVFALSPSLAQKYQYTSDPEDLARQHLGLVPMALEKDAKSIIKMANERKGANIDNVSIDGESTTAPFSWSTVDAGNSAPTEQEFADAVKYLSWLDYQSTWSQQEKASFSNLTPEQQQAAQDQHFEISQIEYQINSLAPEQLAQVAMNLGLPETSTPDDIVSFFREQQQARNQLTSDLNIGADSTNQQITAAQQEQLKQAAVNLGLPETASVADVQAEYEKYLADPIGWTNTYYQNTAPQRIAQQVEQIEAQRSAALNGLQTVGADQEAIDRTNALYDQQVKDVQNAVSAEQKQAIDFIKNEQLVASYDQYKSRADFEGVAAAQLQKMQGMGFGTDMTEDQKKIFAYLRATDTKEADKYMNAIMDSVNQAFGKRLASGVTDKTGVEQLFGVLAGVEGFFGGIAQLFSSEPLGTSGIQYASQNIRNDMISDEEGVNRFLYDFAYSAGNMLPSIGVSMLTGGLASGSAIPGIAGAASKIAGAAGSAALGASAGGQAYGDALRMGYTPTQAKTYGTLIGLSEGGLQFLMGGIGKLGSGVTQGAIANTVSGINNVYLKTAAMLGLKGLSEGAEEYLQEIIDPLLRNAVLGENNEINLLAPQNFEAALMGALMAFAFDGRRVYKDSKATTPPSAKQRGNTAEILKKYASTLDNGSVKDVLNAIADSVAGEQGVQAPVAPQYAPSVEAEQIAGPAAAVAVAPPSNDKASSPDVDVLAHPTSIAAHRLTAVEMTAAVKSLSDTGKVEISRDKTITETLDELYAYREELVEKKGKIEGLKPVNVKGMNTKGVNELVKALVAKENAADKLGDAIKFIDAQERELFSKKQGELLTEFGKLDDIVNDSSNADIKDRVEKFKEKYYTDGKRISNDRRAKLQKELNKAIEKHGSKEKIPAYKMERFAELDKEDVKGMSAEELENWIDETQQLRAQIEFEISEKSGERAAAFKKKIDRVGSTLPTAHNKIGAIGRMIGSPQRIGNVFGPEGNDIMFRDVRMGADTHDANDHAISKLESSNQGFMKLRGEFGADEGISPKHLISDPDLDIEATRSVFLKIYMVGQDIDGYKELTTKGAKIPYVKGESKRVQFTDEQLSNFMANFATNYEDLLPFEDVWRLSHDYYHDPLNEAHRGVGKGDAVTEHMDRRNPKYYTLTKEKGQHIVEEGINAQTGQFEPGFMKERTSGGVLILSNPIHDLDVYTRQANNYVSYAVPVYEASKLMSTPTVRNYLESLGKDKNGKSPIEATLYKWLNDTANGRTRSGDADRVFSKLLSSYGKAQIAMNPGVVVPQLASLPGALSHIDAKHLFNWSTIKEAAQTIFSSEKREMLFNEEPMIYGRLVEGHSMLETGRDIPSYLNGLFKMKGVKYTDAFVTTVVKIAAQKQAAESGGDASAIFHDVMWNTQDQYDAVYRSEWQKNLAGRVLTPFTTQTFQQHNMLWQALQYQQAAKDAAARGETELAEKYSKISKGMGVGVVASVGMYSAMKVLATYLLAGTGRDDEKEKSATKLGSIPIQSLLDVLAPGVSSFAPSWINKGLSGLGIDSQMTDYGFSTPLEQIIDFLNSIPEVITSDKYTMYGRIMKLGARTAELFGVPAENIEKYTTEAMEEIIPGFEYDYLKKKPTANDLAKDYIARGGSIPEVLPSDKQLVYDSYWELVKDANLSGDEVELAKRLKSLSHAITPNASTEASANAMYRAMRDRAVKDTFDSEQIAAIKTVLNNNETTITIAAMNATAKRLGYSGQVSISDNELYELVRKFYR